MALPETAHFLVVRYSDGSPGEARDDAVAVEEPLEIRLAGESLSVTMRTPGHDQELVAGFLLSEGFIRSQADLGTLRHCGNPNEEGYGNVLDVLPGPGWSFELGAAARRDTVRSSACGVCGRQTIEDLLARTPTLTDASPLPASVIAEAPALLAARQPHFATTGGLHAAALLDATGSIALLREDVGRHNAVDKVLGRLVFDDALGAPGRILVVSGRTSFEIVQKAVTAGIGALVGIGAPSSLAITTAARANLALVGFARSDRFNVYCGRERIVPG